MRILAPAVLAVLFASGPAVAQDFFQSLEDFVEEVLPERQAPRPAPRAVPDTEADEPVEAATPTPVEQRPDDKPSDDAAAVEDAPADDAGDEPPLPRPRPEPVAEPEPETEPEPAEEPDVVPDEVEEPQAAEDAPTARAEPERVYQTACPALLSGRIVGEMLAPIAEGICGERSPLSITAVIANGREIPLSSPVTTNCDMAGALVDWVGEVDLYASAALDSPVAGVTSGTSFMCRNRYSAADGFVSEHGFANAVDVVGFTLENGESINVEADWLPATAPEGRLLRQAHGAACGRFTTVLGPEANEDHEDHFHVDLGCHGQSCTAQICE